MNNIRESSLTKTVISVPLLFAGLLFLDLWYGELVVWSRGLIVNNLYGWVLIIIIDVTTLKRNIAKTKAWVIGFSHFNLLTHIRIILNRHQVIKCLLNWRVRITFIIILSLLSNTVLLLIVMFYRLSEFEWALSLGFDLWSFCICSNSFTFTIDIIMNIWANGI